MPKVKPGDSCYRQYKKSNKPFGGIVSYKCGSDDSSTCDNNSTLCSDNSVCMIENGPNNWIPLDTNSLKKSKGVGTKVYKGTCKDPKNTKKNRDKVGLDGDCYRSYKSSMFGIDPLKCANGDYSSCDGVSSECTDKTVCMMDNGNDTWIPVDSTEYKRGKKADKKVYSGKCKNVSYEEKKRKLEKEKEKQLGKLLEKEKKLEKEKEKQLTEQKKLEKKKEMELAKEKEKEKKKEKELQLEKKKEKVESGSKCYRTYEKKFGFYKSKKCGNIDYSSCDDISTACEKDNKCMYESSQNNWIPMDDSKTKKDRSDNNPKKVYEGVCKNPKMIKASSNSTTNSTPTTNPTINNTPNANSSGVSNKCYRVLKKGSGKFGFGSGVTSIKCANNSLDSCTDKSPGCSGINSCMIVDGPNNWIKIDSRLFKDKMGVGDKVYEGVCKNTLSNISKFAKPKLPPSVANSTILNPNEPKSIVVKNNIANIEKLTNQMNVLSTTLEKIFKQSDNANSFKDIINNFTTIATATKVIQKGGMASLNMPYLNYKVKKMYRNIDYHKHNNGLLSDSDAYKVKKSLYKISKLLF